ncbi:malonate transporter [Amylibacter kogurei]|uniref:Malonate transporter n=1 Tax=Paramylibacter kogurei TaxID=1889778 RepID=A0A2G5K601_9RHOB|nr:AEC family transporter [Amylibacter kogurei]PIB24539.1 malonate transporter [Amylibacter kogurei]
MLSIIEIVLPVFLIIGAGYFTVWKGLFAESHVDALMNFTQTYAIPCLLFTAVANLDLAAVFSLDLILSYYIPATSIFVLSGLIAAFGFRRTPGASVSIGFTALFSNMVLLGLPIMERAFGADSLTANYALISIHAPFCYIIGITSMEVLRADGRGAMATFQSVLKAIFKNSLAIGLMLGFLVNFSGVTLPTVLNSAIEMMVRSALPCALFALGGVMVRYHFTNNLPEVAVLGLLKLILFPAFAYILAQHVFDLSVAQRNSVVITAAMAPGINTYIFANLYDRGKATAASAVVILTAISVFTISAWLAFLGA